MSILFSFLFSFFLFSSAFSADLASPSSMMDREEAEYILSFLQPQIQTLPRRINAMNIGLRGSANAIVLLGESGNGKSDAMEAIAALLDPDWSIHRIKERDLHKHAGARGDSTVQFNKLLHAMRQGSGKNFIIMDELNGYLEHFASEHHDTDTFSRTFWEMLDEHLKKPEYFLIGSVNEFDKVPQQVKTRLIDCIFDIPGFTTPEHLSACLRKIQSNRPEFFMQDGNNDYLLQQFTELGVRTARSTRSLMYSVFGEAATFAQDYNHIPVQRAHIDEAIARHKRIAIKIKYGQDVLSDEERRHRENQEMAERHYKENKELQAEYRKHDVTLAKYNAYVSTASSLASIASAEVAIKPNYVLYGNQDTMLRRGMSRIGRALEMTEEFASPPAKPAQSNGCLIQ